MKPGVIQTYDNIVEECAAHEVENGVMCAHYKKFLSFLKPKSKILDAGCGHGQASKKFSERGFEVTGIDLSKNMLAHAKKAAPKAKFLHMDVESISLPEKFDGVWAAFILVHVKREEQIAVLHSFAKLLSVGGVCF